VRRGLTNTHESDGIISDILNLYFAPTSKPVVRPQNSKLGKLKFKNFLSFAGFHPNMSFHE
jgi:hypothetical protein